MKRNFYTTLVLLFALAFSMNAQSTMGPIEVNTIGGNEVVAGDTYPENIPQGTTLNVTGSYGNIGNAVAAWVAYDVYAPDWSGRVYNEQQFIADGTMGELNGTIDFDFTFPEDAAVFGSLDTDSPAFYILQVRVEYDPAEDTFWNLFVQVDESTGTTFPVLEGLEIAPNPATDLISVSTPNNLEKNVQVYNMTGRLVLETNTMNGQIDVSTLAPGMHVVRVEEDGKISGQKLMIK